MCKGFCPADPLGAGFNINWDTVNLTKLLKDLLKLVGLIDYILENTSVFIAIIYKQVCMHIEYEHNNVYYIDYFKLKIVCIYDLMRFVCNLLKSVTIIKLTF